MNICKYCKKDGLDEEMVACATCKGHCHPTCLELPVHIVPAVKKYDWQCNDCKFCYKCQRIEQENKILFCDLCDRGYHMYCLVPKLMKKPKGDWYCPYCIPTQPQLPKKRKRTDSTEDLDTESTISTVTETKFRKARSPLKLKCQFPGCDGSGSIRATGSSHTSLSYCPLNKEEKMREKKLLERRNSETADELIPLAKISKKYQNEEKNVSSSSPPKPISPTEKKKSTENEVVEEEQTRTDSVMTPIENIVSKSDIEMYDKARKHAEEVLELDREMAPSQDGVKYIQFGNIEIEAWYKSQYPLEYSKLPKLFVCEFCLQYLKTDIIYQRHMSKCQMKNPPGDEIYRKENLSVFEVNGETATLYCQNLCLLAKLFLDHKTLWNDVQPFLFYVMTSHDETGCHIIGYFSKEKVSFLNYNLSCILVLPHNMKKGYGKLLIDFSYLLSQEENKVGSPERPLSDLGLISYRKFWADKLLEYLTTYKEDQITVKGISEKMSINTNDVVSTLQYLGMIKYWKGRHLILIKEEIIEEYATKRANRDGDYKEIDPLCLNWTPKVYK